MNIWWKDNNSTIIHQVREMWQDSKLISIASLTSSGGWDRFRGRELIVNDDRGRILYTIPTGLGVRIDTIAVADIIVGMTSVSVEQAKTIHDRCMSFVFQHKDAFNKLDGNDPALIAFRNNLFQSHYLKDQKSPFSRMDIERATHLEAHLRYLSSILV
jgi:hypothetical protein